MTKGRNALRSRDSFNKLPPSSIEGRGPQSQCPQKSGQFQLDGFKKSILQSVFVAMPLEVGTVSTMQKDIIIKRDYLGRNALRSRDNFNS